MCVGGLGGGAILLSLKIFVEPSTVGVMHKSMQNTHEITDTMLPSRCLSGYISKSALKIGLRGWEMIFVVTKDAWRSSHFGANSDWLLQLCGNLYWGSKLVMTCRVQAQQKRVPRCLSVVCDGWKGMLHVQWLSSSLAVYSTNRTDSWAPRRSVACEETQQD